jgi:AcrR family transcriptional regulator
MKWPPPTKNLPSADRPRGRPRSLEARRAILKATHELLAEGGLPAVTIEGIAARAGVGKPTIYRTWPNAHAVAMAALMENDNSSEPADAAGHRVSPPSAATSKTSEAPTANEEGSGSALAALRTQLHEVARVFSAPLGRSVTQMIAAAEPDTELSKAFRNHFILARRNEGRAFLATAMLSGEIRQDLDIDVGLDLIYAPVFYRLLMGHAPLTSRFIDDVLNLALQGILTTGHQRRP